MKRAVVVLIVLLMVLHQDFWWWNDITPLAFGFIPIGLAYHIVVSIAAGVLWAVAVHYCWPADVDVPDESPAAPGSGAPRARTH